MTRRIDSLVLGWLLAGTISILALGLTACGSDDESPTVPVTNGCMDCHGDEARLMATVDPDEEPENEDPGEG